jgi:hypothetical protein
MPDEAALGTIRAAVEVIVPSAEGRAGAADLGVERHVVEAIEQYLPGFVDLLATLLDAYAAEVRPGAAFRDLSSDERSQVLRSMTREESPDMQDIVDGLMVFTYGGFYSEWTGYDKKSRALTPPEAWVRMGYRGPTLGVPEYREGI